MISLLFVFALISIVAADIKCEKQHGKCYDYHKKRCWSHMVSGLRGSNENRKCCMPCSISDPDCLHHRRICEYNSNYCSGSYANHKCRGPQTCKCCLLVAAGPWGTICQGNPRNTVRGDDKYGAGYYGAPRGPKKHLGVDVICRDGSIVYAPFTGVIGGRANPYSKNNAINNGLLLRGSGNCPTIDNFLKKGFCIHMFYIRPYRYSGQINKGQRIGVMLPMQKVYPGITSHVHVQNCNLSDPTRNL